MTTEEKCKLKKLLDKCPSGIATAEMDLMDFVYSTDLSYQDYMELGWMIMVRMQGTMKEVRNLQIEDLIGVGPGSIFNTGAEKHAYFGLEPGDAEITAYYADNEIHSLEVSFSVSADVWNELQSQPFFLELTEFLKNHRQETLEMRTRSFVQECTGGNLGFDESFSVQDSRESFWARVHRFFRMQRYR